MRVDRRELAAVFAGGILGALARAGLVEALPQGAILVANLLGTFALGYFVTRLQERLPLSSYRRPFLGTGVCGALTTFSTLQIELLDMAIPGRRSPTRWSQRDRRLRGCRAGDEPGAGRDEPSPPGSALPRSAASARPRGSCSTAPVSARAGSRVPVGNTGGQRVRLVRARRGRHERRRRHRPARRVYDVQHVDAGDAPAGRGRALATGRPQRASAAWRSGLAAAWLGRQL